MSLHLESQFNCQIKKCWCLFTIFFFRHWIVRSYITKKFKSSSMSNLKSLCIHIRMIWFTYSNTIRFESKNLWWCFWIVPIFLIKCRINHISNTIPEYFFLYGSWFYTCVFSRNYYDSMSPSQAWTIPFVTNTWISENKIGEGKYVWYMTRKS